MLPSPQHGEQFECPHCQRTFAFFESQQAPPLARRIGVSMTVDRAAAAGLPPADGDEVDVLIVRPSAARSQPLQFFGFTVLAVLGLGAGLFGWGNSWHPAGWIACALGGVAASSLPLWMKLSSLRAKIRITSKRVVDTDGFFEKRTSEVLHKDIRNVRVDQTLMQRLWRVGSVAVFTGGEEVPEIYMEDVPDPQRIREVIDRYRPL